MSRKTFTYQILRNEEFYKIFCVVKKDPKFHQYEISSVQCAVKKCPKTPKMTFTPVNMTPYFAGYPFQGKFYLLADP